MELDDLLINIKLFKSKTKLMVQHDKWKKICAYLNWLFIPYINIDKICIKDIKLMQHYHH